MCGSSHQLVLELRRRRPHGDAIVRPARSERREQLKRRRGAEGAAGRGGGVHLRRRLVSGFCQRSSELTKGGARRHGSCWCTHGKTRSAPTCESDAMRRASLTGRCMRSSAEVPERVRRVEALR